MMVGNSGYVIKTSLILVAEAVVTASYTSSSVLVSIILDQV